MKLIQISAVSVDYVKDSVQLMRLMVYWVRKYFISTRISVLSVAAV